MFGYNRILIFMNKNYFIGDLYLHIRWEKKNSLIFRFVIGNKYMENEYCLPNILGANIIHKEYGFHQLAFRIYAIWKNIKQSVLSYFHFLSFTLKRWFSKKISAQFTGKLLTFLFGIFKYKTLCLQIWLLKWFIRLFL